ncbi:hypothetical protein GTS_15600 [Gandjariella thermophila]|uniref:Uncharacterized protein n=1 Tax=Gandjariella thermophila TaxID=1931992 RepID=A0A4D4J7J4_9PSEU|nr:hypothetical protein GTS_15600 [Gandjariella thermophila]
MTGRFPTAGINALAHGLNCGFANRSGLNAAATPGDSYRGIRSQRVESVTNRESPKWLPAEKRGAKVASEVAGRVVGGLPREALVVAVVGGTVGPSTARGPAPGPRGQRG